MILTRAATTRQYRQRHGAVWGAHFQKTGWSVRAHSGREMQGGSTLILNLLLCWGSGRTPIAHSHRKGGRPVFQVLNLSDKAHRAVVAALSPVLRATSRSSVST